MEAAKALSLLPLVAGCKGNSCGGEVGIIEIGIVGLGRMGGSIVQGLLREGRQVVAYDHDPDDLRREFGRHAVKEAS